MAGQNMKREKRELRVTRVMGVNNKATNSSSSAPVSILYHKAMRERNSRVTKFYRPHEDYSG